MSKKAKKTKKYITLKFPVDDWKSARWVISCFQVAIHDCYAEGAPRRVEADNLHETLHEQARAQVNALPDDVRLEDHYDT